MRPRNSAEPQDYLELHYFSIIESHRASWLSKGQETRPLCRTWRAAAVGLYGLSVRHPLRGEHLSQHLERGF